MKSFKPGQKVAHRDVDGPDGGARVGRVEEVIGDENGSLVVARWEGDVKEGFDDRELKSIARSSDDTPVIFHLRHMRVLLRRRRFSLAAMVAIFVPFVLAFLVWEEIVSVKVALACGAIGLGFILILAGPSRKK